MFCCYSKDVPLALMILFLSTFSDCKYATNELEPKESESKGLEGGEKYLLSHAEGGNTFATCEKCGPSAKYGRPVFCCSSNDVAVALMVPLSHNKESGCKGLEGERKYLISDTGKMLARCFQCGTSVKFEESVAVHGNHGDLWAQFTFEPIGDKCLIKSDIGFYIAECQDCWKGGKYSLPVFSHVKSPNPESAWRVEKHGDLYSFKADSGNYMARCRDCVPSGLKEDFAFSFATAPISIALWNVTSV